MSAHIWVVIFFPSKDFRVPPGFSSNGEAKEKHPSGSVLLQEPGNKRGAEEVRWLHESICAPHPLGGDMGEDGVEENLSKG